MRRTNANETQLSPDQEAWIAAKTNASVARNVPWQFYVEGTIMQVEQLPICLDKIHI